MNDLKTIGQNLVELAADPSDPIGQTISQCPCVKALLESIGQEQQVVSTHNDLNEWIDNQDVMQALHISPRTLQTLRSNGTLPYSRINNKIYYRRKDVENLLNANYSCNNQHSQKGGIR